MPSPKTQIVICTYRVKPGKEAEFRKLLDRHWPTLNRLGLVAPEPRLVMRGAGKENRNDLVEIFAWNERGYEVGHTMPEVLAIWEPMEQLCEPRGGRPAMEFPHYELLSRETELVIPLEKENSGTGVPARL